MDASAPREPCPPSLQRPREQRPVLVQHDGLCLLPLPTDSLLCVQLQVPSECRGRLYVFPVAWAIYMVPPMKVFWGLVF